MVSVQSQKDQVLELFESHQQTWEEVYHRSDYGSRGFQWRQESGIMLCRRYVPSGGRILDAGCGCGHASITLAAHGYKVVGLDISESMIAQATRNAASLGLSASCSFRVGDLAAEQSSLGHFDGILALGFIEYFDDPVRILDQLRSMLRPGGVLAVQIWNSRALPDLVFNPLLEIAHPVRLAKKVVRKCLPKGVVENFRAPQRPVALEDEVEHRRYTPREIESLARLANLELVDSSGSRFFTNRSFFPTNANFVMRPGFRS